MTNGVMMMMMIVVAELFFFLNLSELTMNSSKAQSSICHDYSYMLNRCCVD